MKNVPSAYVGSRPLHLSPPCVWRATRNSGKRWSQGGVAQRAGVAKEGVTRQVARRGGLTKQLLLPH